MASAAVGHGLGARTPRPAVRPRRRRRQSRSIQSWAWCWQRLVVDGGGLPVTALAPAAAVLRLRRMWHGSEGQCSQGRRAKAEAIEFDPPWHRSHWTGKQKTSQVNQWYRPAATCPQPLRGMQTVTFAAARSRLARPTRLTRRNLPDKRCGRNGTQESATGRFLRCDRAPTFISRPHHHTHTHTNTWSTA